MCPSSIGKNPSMSLTDLPTWFWIAVVSGLVTAVVTLAVPGYLGSPRTRPALAYRGTASLGQNLVLEAISSLNPEIWVYTEAV